MKKVMDAPVDVPKLEDFPDYVEAYELLGQFKARRDELAVEISQAQAQCDEARKKPDAERLLAGESLDALVVEPDQSKVSALMRKQQAVRGAIEIQERKLRGVVSECSRTACEQVLPQFNEFAGRVARLTRELGEANDAMQDLAERLQDDGFTWSAWIWPAWTGQVGSLTRDDYSRANQFLRECAEHGVVEA